MNYLRFILFVLFPILSCSKNDDGSTPGSDETLYFPPNSDAAWETKTFTSLGWNEASVQPLKDFLSQKHTKSFMILVNGRIVMEEYFNGHSSVTSWQWNSAGKTLVATTTGIAQQEGLLNINNKVSQYLGAGWTERATGKGKFNYGKALAYNDLGNQ